ncbi:MAG: hypothetical protein JG777_2802 [Clostridia bacterium]|nr:hypothetical protein [Clostridia bacterium]
MSRKILVVDDEKPIVDILKFNLKKEGYNVIEPGPYSAGCNAA